MCLHHFCHGIELVSLFLCQAAAVVGEVDGGEVSRSGFHHFGLLLLYGSGLGHRLCLLHNRSGRLLHHRFLLNDRLRLRLCNDSGFFHDGSGLVLLPEMIRQFQTGLIHEVALVVILGNVVEAVARQAGDAAVELQANVLGHSVAHGSLTAQTEMPLAVELLLVARGKMLGARGDG